MKIGMAVLLRAGFAAGAGLITGRYQQRFRHEANVPPPTRGMDVKERTLGQALEISVIN